MKKQKRACTLFFMLCVCCFLVGAGEYYKKNFKTEIQQYYHASNNGINAGNIHIYFYDSKAQLQKGAVFRIARKASIEELGNDTIPKDKIVHQATGYTVVYESFISDRDDRGKEYVDLEASRTGALLLTGIPEGLYFLVETKPPNGCQKTESIYSFTIERNDSAMVSEEISRSDSCGSGRLIIEHKRYNLSELYYADTQLYTAGIFSIIGAALAWLSFSSKKAYTYQQI